ncbi:ABC transporter ATP-binding protein [Xanthobacter versatilis]|uniref:ABC transporter ATP-binding protein n=1 Tax=Xanthobacter autotrophicus (strain ATCC BAA-1158 / Py2) TaxID=78245 RepID=UPI00372B5ED1
MTSQGSVPTAAHPAATSSLLEIRGLEATFPRRGSDVHALRCVDLSVAAGSTLCLLGESGSGKSLTLKAILGLLPRGTAVSGRILFEGIDLLKAPPGVIAQVRGGAIGMIFQEPMTAFDPVFTIGHQIAETIVRHEGVEWRAAEVRAKELLERVAIPAAKRRLANYPHEISGGMRQRAMIALALACNPKLLLADEPTTALDVTVQIQILLLLRQLQEEIGMTMVFVTHDIGVAAEISDNVAVMYAGRIVERGSSVETILSPRHPYTQAMLASTVHGGMKGRDLVVLPGAPPDPESLIAGCAFAPRCSHREEACERGDIALMPAQGHAVRCLQAGAEEVAGG